MTLALDSSTPAALYTGWHGGVPAASATTASFTPPGGAVIVVVLEAWQSFADAWQTTTFTDNLATPLTWTVSLVRAPGTDTGAWGGVWVGWAYVGGLSPGAMTVTANFSIPSAGGQYVINSILSALVFTGAKTSGPFGASTTGLSSSVPLSASLTPTSPGSALMLAAVRQASSSSASTTVVPGTNDSLLWSQPTTATGTIVFALEWVGTSATSPTLTPNLSSQALTMGNADSATVTWEYVGFEVLPVPVPDTTPPSTPGNLRTTFVGSSTIGLAWDASTDNVGVTGYEVTVTGPT